MWHTGPNTRSGGPRRRLQLCQEILAFIEDVMSGKICEGGATKRAQPVEIRWCEKLKNEELRAREDRSGPVLAEGCQCEKMILVSIHLDDHSDLYLTRLTGAASWLDR